MGFWDVAKKVGSVAGDVAVKVAHEAEKQANEIREIKEKYSQMDDNELCRIVNSDGFFGKSKSEKAVAFKILKERGYTSEDIKERG